MAGARASIVGILESLGLGARRLVPVAAVGAAAIFVGIRALAPLDPAGLDRGDRAPPLVPAAARPLDGFGDERILGPGYRNLMRAIRLHRVPGESVTFHPFVGDRDETALDRARASYLRREFPDALIAADGELLPGLQVYFGGEARGDFVARTELAVLARSARSAK
jgi:hypothetical protein